MIAALTADPIAATARVTFAEVAAALAVGARLGRVADLRRAMATFRADWAGLVVVDVDQPLVEAAADLAARHGLRGYDAVQLSAAISAAGGHRAQLRFASFGAALARAAVAERLQPAI